MLRGRAYAMLPPSSTAGLLRLLCAAPRPAHQPQPAPCPPARLPARWPACLQVASLLLLWLRSLPEPLFPAALVPELVTSQQSDYYDERVAAVRSLLKRVGPEQCRLNVSSMGTCVGR